nr:MAG TPA: hypothetical protein [Caudoviricetes sp.]DAL54056.1 MAG TPA_asm: hypothetical protein [Bacteriophage sp.]DAQ24168.1 MAG TPA: hypothetical protein [Caudoviricetes sp.]DAW87044.1 MAG TPA: hypothetical protein [Caudoviricetes sp.]
MANAKLRYRKNQSITRTEQRLSITKPIYGWA